MCGGERDLACGIHPSSNSTVLRKLLRGVIISTMNSLWAKRKEHYGFTIVELLIVIVVIGILATITVVAYNGIQARSKTLLLSVLSRCIRN